MDRVQNELCNRIQDLLTKAKNLPIDAIEIEGIVESGFLATARMGAAENLEHHREQTISITVYKDKCTGHASASDLSTQALQHVLDKAISIAQFSEPDPLSGLAPQELMAFDYPNLELSHPWHISPKKALDLSIACDTYARTLDNRITQTEDASVATTTHFKVYANSNGFIGFYPTTMHSMSISLIAEANGQMERDYYYSSVRVPKNLESYEEIAKIAARKTLERLNSRKIDTRRCPIIFTPRVAKSLLSHFVSAITGSNLYRRKSFLYDCLGQKIFPDFINIYQRPHIKAGYGSAPFDNQGVKTRDINYITDGLLTSYALGDYSAKKLNLQTTGNAGGVFNLFISHGEKDLAALCREIGTGLVVTELLGQGVNLLSGEYSRGAFGFWVEHGEIQFPVHEITIASNLKDMFSNIIAVGNDIENPTNITTGSIVISEMMIAGL